MTASTNGLTSAIGNADLINVISVIYVSITLGRDPKDKRPSITVSAADTSVQVLFVFAFCFAYRRYELLIALRQLIAVSVYQNILIAFGIIEAVLFNERITLEYALRYKRHPHKGLGIFRQKVELTSALVDEDTSVNARRAIGFSRFTSSLYRNSVTTS